MKTLEMVKATAPLAEYAQVSRDPVILTMMASRLPRWSLSKMLIGRR